MSESSVPSGWINTNSRRCGVTQQCSFVKADGDRCLLQVPAGMKVCHKHGANGRSREAAKRMLMDLRYPAVGVVKSIVDPEVRCDACGHGILTDPALALKAAQIVLDRTGFGPTLHLEQDHSHQEFLVEHMTDEELAIVDGVMERVEARLREQGLLEERELATEHPTPERYPALTAPPEVGNQDSPSAPSVEEPAEPASLPDPEEQDVEEFG